MRYQKNNPRHATLLSVHIIIFNVRLPRLKIVFPPIHPRHDIAFSSLPAKNTMPIYVHTIEEARKVIYDALIQGPVFDHSHPPTQVDVDRQMDAQDYGLECVLIAYRALLFNFIIQIVQEPVSRACLLSKIMLIEMLIASLRNTAYHHPTP